MVFEEQEISLSELTAILKKRWLLILIPSIIAAVTVGVASRVYYGRMPAVYAAQALMKVGGSSTQPYEKTDELSAIMNSYGVRVAIADAVTAEGFHTTPDAVAGSLRYAKESTLVNIHAFAARPELAAAMTNAAVRVIDERHRRAYESALRERDELVQYVKETAKPLAVTFSDISALRLSPTVVVASATANPVPVAHPKKSVALPVFAFVAFIMSLIAVYLHATQKKTSVPEQR